MFKRMFKKLILAATLSTCLGGAWAQATYTAASSTNLNLNYVWMGDGSGSPFVAFAEQFDAACYDGRGLYLFNVMTPGTAQSQNQTLAVALLAKATGKRVAINYMRGGPTSSWGACYMTGIAIIE